MASKQIEVLLRERNSFIAHEQRIIAERDEILANIRSHISALDIEIDRLGGGDRSETSTESRYSAESVIPSVSLFPPVKKLRGRPPSDNSTKKKRGRPRKSDSETLDGNEKAPSEDSILPNKSCSGPPKTPAVKNDVPDDAMSPLTSIAASLISMKTGSIGIPSAAVTDVNTNAEPEDWKCECGLMIEGTKTRCGKCRRWKGGKREKKWTIKDKDGKSSSQQKKGRKSKTAKSIYTQLSAKQDVNGLPLSPQDGNADSSEGDINIRSEVEDVIGDMLTAVAGANPKRKRSSTLSDPDKKRKRGRPSKKASEQQGKEGTVDLQPTKKESHVQNAATHTPLAFESLFLVANYMN